MWQVFRVLQLAVSLIAAHHWELPETLAGQVTREVAGTAQEIEGQPPQWGMRVPWWVGADLPLGFRVGILELL